MVVVLIVFALPIVGHVVVVVVVVVANVMRFLPNPQKMTRPRHQWLTVIAVASATFAPTALPHSSLELP